MQFRSVDLPAPLGPIKPTISASATRKDTSASARSPENERDRLLISSSGIEGSPQGGVDALHEADQAAGEILHAGNESDAVDHHLRVLELAQHLRSQRQVRSAEKRAGARMQTSDDRHGQKGKRQRQRESLGAQVAQKMGVERARDPGVEGAQSKRDDDVSGPSYPAAFRRHRAHAQSHQRTSGMRAREVARDPGNQQKNREQ